MAVIGVIADDFTGTASAGVFIARNGARTGLFFDIWAVKKFADINRLDAVYVSSNSRHYEPKRAYKEVKMAAEELKKLGIQYFSKKIDTTLRGQIGYEIDAMLDALGQEMTAVVVTAMPQSKRICIGGYAVIDSVMLQETPIAKDVKTPVNESYIPALLETQTRYPVGLIEIKNVMKGPWHIKEKLSALISEGRKIIVVDAVSMEHIDDIARACAEMKQKVLAVDPGPFTMKLSHYRGVTETQSTRENKIVREKENSDKAVLVVAGSANPETGKQIRYLCSHVPACEKISVSPGRLLSKYVKDEVRKASEKAIHALNAREQKVIIIETGSHGELIDLSKEDQSAGLIPGTSSAKINDGLAQITERILSSAGQKKIAGIVLTGGDTMESVCRKTGVECIEAIDNIVAQVDIGRVIGRYDGLPIVVKGGFCGGEDIGVKIVERLLSNNLTTS